MKRFLSYAIVALVAFGMGYAVRMTSPAKKLAQRRGLDARKMRLKAGQQFTYAVLENSSGFESYAAPKEYDFLVTHADKDGYELATLALASKPGTAKPPWGRSGNSLILVRVRPDLTRITEVRVGSTSFYGPEIEEGGSAWLFPHVPRKVLTVGEAWEYDEALASSTSHTVLRTRYRLASDRDEINHVRCFRIDGSVVDKTPIPITRRRGFMPGGDFALKEAHVSYYTSRDTL